MNAEKYSLFLTELMDESDRAAIVLGVAQIDVLLEEVLKKKLTLARSEVFDFKGPLGTLSSRIELSYALGLLDSDFRIKLDILRNIRNACAHNIKNVNLASGSIASQIQELERNFKSNAYWIESLSECEKIFKISGNKLILRFCIAVLTINLVMVKSHVSNLDTSDAYKVILPNE